MNTPASTQTLTSATFLRAIDLTRVPALVYDEAYEATTQYVPWPKAYGGDMVAQSAAAMMRSVDDDRSLHSMHSYFMRPVDVGSTVRYEVERLRDGRGYSTRSVRGYQNGKAVFAALGSFHVPEDGAELQPVAPEHMAAGGLDPESLRSAAEILADEQGPAAKYWSTGRSFDMRHVPGPVYVEVEGGHEPHQAIWVKAFGKLPDSPDERLNANLHRAALAYVCDYTILEPLLRAQGLHWSSPGLTTASLDHSMWFHREGRVDEWVLYAQKAVSGQSNRGLALGHFFDQAGRLLATVAQEGMIRPGS
ncbi:MULTISPECIES: acyl-CoA thioesterase II [Arthrobacter]|uniref:Acyl-CoA thioesterase II n=1 Tax=Arthrobacter terricola TaxID=2547396 RepID=A0A4R5KGJ1_9MICC|nr:MULTISPECIES: acyl-CoA thioesterase domain-containing protein [Arthrobacter]MBT8162387.1 thioesterase family protein [Arthrobacter sp. GN70]TDF93360.1 acyl-CoA thioesterase II [Arthrobacter terricola]